EPVPEEGQHRLDRGRPHRRRRGVVEVRERHGTTLPSVVRAGTVPVVEGYDDTTYGRAFADVYDAWYTGISDVDVTVAVLAELAGGGPVLELGVGTGRLAIPLAERLPHLRVVGVDTSDEMLERLRARHCPATLEVRRGDMVDGLPDGPFALVFVAYNTIFNLLSADRQQACFA